MTTPQPGWYDDPENSNAQRYWDGQGWTEQRQPKGASGSTPPPPPPVVAAPPPPPGAAPPFPAQGVPYAGAGAGQSAADPLATVKGLVANFTPKTWLLYGGLAFAFLTVFFPWVTISVMGMEEGSGDVGPHLGWKYVALLAIIAAAVLAWPTVVGSALDANRLIGLSAAVGVLFLGVVFGFFEILSFSSKLSSEIGGLVQASPGFGLYLFAAAVIASAAGVVWVWIDRSKV
jgi:Protein of unknown function (DUF2510)